MSSPYFDSCDAICEDPALGPIPSVVFSRVWRFCGPGGAGVCFASHQTLATKCGIGVSTVRRAIASLKAAGWVDVQSGRAAGQTSTIRIASRVLEGAVAGFAGSREGTMGSFKSNEGGRPERTRGSSRLNDDIGTLRSNYLKTSTSTSIPSTNYMGNGNDEGEEEDPGGYASGEPSPFSQPVRKSPAPVASPNGAERMTKSKSDHHQPTRTRPTRFVADPIARDEARPVYGGNFGVARDRIATAYSLLFSVVDLAAKAGLSELEYLRNLSPERRASLESAARAKAMRAIRDRKIPPGVYARLCELARAVEFTCADPKAMTLGAFIGIVIELFMERRESVLAAERAVEVVQ